MIPSRNFDNFPTFASAGSRVPPDNAKYAAGFVPNDTYPAAWANYFIHGATKGISDLNPVVKSLIDECNNVVTASGQTPDATNNTQLYTAMRSFSKDRLTISSTQTLTVNSDTVARMYPPYEEMTLTLADSVIVGAELILYTNSVQNTLIARTPEGNNTQMTLPMNGIVHIAWNGACWVNLSAPGIGGTFVQFPDCPEPKVVYPCSQWIKAQYQGAFFRCEGGNAQAFAGQTAPQAQGLPNITGHFGTAKSDDTWKNWQAGALYFEGAGKADGNEGTTRFVQTLLHIDASRSNAIYGAAEEVRPENFTIVVWYRMA